jgi:hypothetical protein
LQIANLFGAVPSLTKRNTFLFRGRKKEEGKEAFYH